MAGLVIFTLFLTTFAAPVAMGQPIPSLPPEVEDAVDSVVSDVADINNQVTPVYCILGPGSADPAGCLTTRLLLLVEILTGDGVTPPAPCADGQTPSQEDPCIPPLGGGLADACGTNPVLDALVNLVAADTCEDSSPPDCGEEVNVPGTEECVGPSDVNLAALCSVDVVGPAVAELLAPGTCGGTVDCAEGETAVGDQCVAGPEPSQLEPLCAVPTVGPAVVGALGGSCPDSTPPEQVTKLQECLAQTTEAAACMTNSGPILEEVHLESDNAKSDSLAKAGDAVTLTFDASDDVQNVDVAFSIGGTAFAGTVTVTETDAANDLWSATFDAPDGSNGAVTFTIDYEDAGGAAQGQVTATTDSSSVTVDTIDPAVDITFPDDADGNGVINTGDANIQVEFDLVDVDNAASSGSYTTPGNAATAIPLDDADGSIDVAVVRGTLAVTFDLEDDAGNTAVVTESVAVFPDVPITLSILEGNQDAANKVRHFAEDQARTYTVSVTHVGTTDSVASVAIRFAGEGVAVTAVSEDDQNVIQFEDSSGSTTAIEVDPFVVQDETRSFTFTITGNPLLTGDSATATVELLNAAAQVLTQVSTEAVGDRAAPAEPGHDFVTDDDGDGAITRAEYQDEGSKILLDVTGIADNTDGSGVVRAEVRTTGDAPAVVASSAVGAEDEDVTLELPLASLEPGDNDLLLVLVDGVGNERAKAVSIDVAILQRIIVEPAGAVYLQPDGAATVAFTITQDDVVDSVTRYDLRAKRVGATVDFYVETYVDDDNNPEVGTSQGTVRLVRYAGPGAVLAVSADVNVPAGVPDGENKFDLEVITASNDIQVVDADNEPFADPVFRVVVDDTDPVLVDATVSDGFIDESEAAGGFSILADVAEANPYTVTVEDAMGAVVGTSDGGPVQLATPAPGTHTYTVSVADAAGNAAAQTVDVTVVVQGPAAIDVDGLVDDASADGTLDFTETGTSWDVRVTGLSVPDAEAGCPCTYYLYLTKQDGDAFVLVGTERTGDIAHGETVVESLDLTGAADGTYGATVRLLSAAGETLASDRFEDVVVAVQPRVTAFAATVDAGARDITGTSEPATSDSSAEVTVGFTLDATRAGLASAAINSPLGYTTSAQGTLSSTSGLTIPVAADGSASTFTLDLDSTGDAAHGVTEVFSLRTAGANGLVPTVDVVERFGFRFDKAVDLLTIDVQKTGVGELTLSYDVQDAGFGLDALSITVDDGTPQTVTFSGERDLQTGTHVVTGLADGSYEFAVTATDLAGNTADAAATALVNDDADVQVQVLEGTTDRMGGTVVIPNGDLRELVLRVTNGADEPTLAEVTLARTAGTSIVAQATGWDEATTAVGGDYETLTFLVEVPAGATLDRAFSLRASADDGAGTWSVTARTADGYTVSAVNGGVDALDIRTPEPVAPTASMQASQGGVDLVDAAGVLHATLDQAAPGDLDGSDAVTFAVTVVDGTDPVEGAVVDVPELRLEATTGADGVATFVVDPDDHDLDLAATGLTFHVAPQQALRAGVPVELSETSVAATVLWTGFHVDVTGDSVAAHGFGPGLGEADLDADVYWLHEVVQTDGTVDVGGATPIADLTGATLSLTESVGAQALTADQTDLDAVPTTVERGALPALGTATDTQAGYRAYTANLGGALPNGVGAVYSSDEHVVLFTGLRLVFTQAPSVAFGGEEASVRAQWLHATGLDGTPIDRFDLGSDVVTLGGGLGTLEAGNGNLFTHAPALAEGVNALTYTGDHPVVLVFQASTEVLLFDAAFGATPADVTLAVGAPYAGAFTVMLNGVAVDDATTVASETLTTTLAGEAATAVDFVGQALDLSQVGVLLGGSPVTATSAYDGAEWDLGIADVSSGSHTLVVDLALGSLDGTPVALELEDEFVVTQNLHRVGLTGVSGATDDSDLLQVWADRDAGTVALQFLAEEGDWDGTSLTNAVPAADGTQVEAWVLTDGTWSAAGTHTLAAGDGTGSIDLSALPDGAAGVRDVRLVVVHDGTDAFPATDGLNAQSAEAETQVVFTGVTVSFAGAADAAVLAGGSIPVDLVATYDHDGSPVAGLELTVAGTGVGPTAATTGIDGTAQASLTSATVLKATDVAVTVTGIPAHGLTHTTGDDLGAVLRWVAVEVSGIAFETSTDGATFAPADSADVDEATNTVTATPGTYVRVITTVVMDDGTASPPAVDGGSLQYGTRTVALDGSGTGSRTYFSSQAGSLPVAVSVDAVTYGDAVFVGGAGDDFTVVWA